MEWLYLLVGGLLVFFGFIMGAAIHASGVDRGKKAASKDGEKIL